MLIWMLALVLFGALGYIGFALGVIRVAFTFIGLLVASLLAWPLGHLMSPVLGMVGLKNPVLVWLLGPFVVFIIILIVFKVCGMVVHKKVDVYYKYKAGELRMGLWNRLSARLGICVGLANAAVYLILISTVIYVLSYATTQMVSGDNGTWLLKTFNTAGGSVESSGMAKVAAAIDPIPEDYYRAVDIIGLIYHNDLLESRLSRYPAFLALGEQAEFQEIGKDKAFTELRQRQAPMAEILDYPKAQNIMNNPDKLKEIWGIVEPNLTDLQTFLTKGKSAKYDEEGILGRWTFNLAAAVGMFKQGKPNVAPPEMMRVRHSMSLIFAKTTFVAAADKQAFLKSVGKLRPPAKPNLLPTAVDMQNFHGQWSGDSGKYEISLTDKKHKLEAVVEGDKLKITGDPFPMVFDREY
jgi:hypothetical protein